ncbi:hypothetical protein [Microbacterium candidum]|uniref:Lipoprotein n=1 Tax=Microbacterium candidum TaxID=3041922 RepID=A0ABT7MU75_9MICO|nr:hypothetical protein [Microbacterium sp. ASV49]MDL9977999.1 hypothetical protein [Microbacterium sp. ASV49]
MTDTTSPSARRAASLALSLAAVALLAGCAGTAGGSAASDSTLVVRDGALRAPGTACSGSGQYLFVHAGVHLTVTDGSGGVVLDAALPSGTATRADDNDYGNAARVPTFCTFDFAAAGLEAGSTYDFSIEGRSLGSAAFQPDASGGFRFDYPALGDPAAVQGGDR